jgi:DNA-binding NtrC family response regulator
VEIENDSLKSKAEEQAPRPTRTVLLVDDAHQLRLVTKLFLVNSGFIVHSFSSAEDALSHFDCRVHDLIVTDNTMPGMTGEEMAYIIKMRSPSTPVVMYSGKRPIDCSCLDFYVEKPASLASLKNAVDKLLARPRSGPKGPGGSISESTHKKTFPNGSGLDRLRRKRIDRS